MTIPLLNVKYAQTGSSIQANPMGMREMQAKAYAKREAQYLLLKAPPASGKSRALMFLALAKLKQQGLKKAIIAVPEMSIGGSFQNTPLSQFGFFADWVVAPENNLCTDDNEGSKVAAFQRFMVDEHADILVCTHATLRFAFDAMNNPSVFNHCLVAIDEFHHVSASEDNKLGALIDGLMKRSDAHIVAMTGSYFRGDAVPILPPEDEALFEKVTYTYYEQLNGYQHLKTLGLGYHFYQGRYLDALKEVLDPNKKTIIHIPNVNSGEAAVDKYSAVGHIIDVLGEEVGRDRDTGIITVQTKAGKRLKVADLVDDHPLIRPLVQAYLRNIKHRDDVDIIIALGMAKEGFDWPFCEHVLTIGYRSSMTEVVQIIGRATRDCEGKSHAQFTNLIAQPDAADEDVVVSVNNLLKAITLSLLMEQVLAPNIKFKRRSDWLSQPEIEPGTIVVDDSVAPVSDKVLSIINGERDEIMAVLAKRKEVQVLMTNDADTEVVNQTVLPKVIFELYPDLSEQESEQVQQALLTSFAINQQGGVLDGKDLPVDAVIEGERTFVLHEGIYIDVTTVNEQVNGHLLALPRVRERDLPVGGHVRDESGDIRPASQKFVRMGKQFINVENLPLDLIKEVNPFQAAYEVLSKHVDADILKTIQGVVASSKIQMTEDEAVIWWPKIKLFVAKHQREPFVSATDHDEKRMAEALIYIRHKKAQALARG